MSSRNDRLDEYEAQEFYENPEIEDEALEAEEYDAADYFDDELLGDDEYDENEDEVKAQFIKEDDEEAESEEDGEEYDEDVFSLEDDLKREQVKQWVQYLVFAACAALVVALALYGSIVLTHKRLASQQSIEVVPKNDENVISAAGDAETQTAPQNAFETIVEYWPSAMFPVVPELESEAYETTMGEGYAEVAVPSDTAKRFDKYISDLVDTGASIYVRTTRLSVLKLDDVEIHLVSNNIENKVVLCGETAIEWNDEGYSAFLLPEAGKLVKVEEGIGAGSRVLTYRLASALDALNYTSQLMEDGWTISGTLEPENNLFTAVMKKNNMQITVDYFSSDDAYQVKLDYIN